jgi:hypothetical protein
MEYFYKISNKFNLVIHTYWKKRINFNFKTVLVFTRSIRYYECRFIAIYMFLLRYFKTKSSSYRS